MSDDDLDLFRSAMGDVKPIKSEAKVRLRPDSDDKNVLRARREAAQAVDDRVSGPLSVDYVQQVESQAVLSFIRPGIQHSLFKKLKQGLLPMEAQVDLHGMTVEQARSTVLEFIRDCCQHEIRFALITHGKGEGRAQPARTATIKMYCARGVKQRRQWMTVSAGRCRWIMCSRLNRRPC